MPSSSGDSEGVRKLGIPIQGWELALAAQRLGRERVTPPYAPDTLSLLIDRHQTFRMELTQGHMQRDLLWIDRLQAIQGKSDAFADTDTGGAHEAESVALQGVGETELLLQALILLQGKRSRQILVARGEILATNEVGRQGMSLVGQVTQDTAELDETLLAN